MARSLPARKHIAAAALAAMALAAGGARGAGPLILPDAEKPRVVIMTDIGGDPDDRQSMVRFLLYACDVRVEGLCTGFGHGHYRQTRPELIRRAVEAYGKVESNLRLHRADYPPARRLMGLIKDGHNGDPHRVGEGMDSEASEWILRLLDRDDPRPVWFCIWGGPRELAQAIWKASKGRSPADLAAWKRKIRVHSIADQDRTAGWVKKNHPDVFWIFSDRLFRGIWAEGDQQLVSRSWLERNVLSGHGPLGGVYPSGAAGKDGVKEGDTPSFFHVLPLGLTDPNHPEWGGWGGRFRRSGRGSEYVPDADYRAGRRDLYYGIHRWRRAYQNAFEARMDWCVRPFEKANHAPTAVLNGDRSRRVLTVPAAPGSTVRLTAAGSSDPDGDVLHYRWWVYVEAGTYWTAPKLSGADAPGAQLAVPADAAGRTIHVILEVTDAGSPPLTAYRRAVVKVSGSPVAPPAGGRVHGGRRPAPVTHLPGPPAKSGPWEFFRGINVNGPAVVIDGQRWLGEADGHLASSDRALNSPQVPLNPPTDPARAKMIHSFRWSRRPRLVVRDVPAGRYAVYVYVWEETSPETFDVFVQGRRVARDVDSGLAGDWQRLGPWVLDAAGGTIEISARGGAANFSGIEIWRKR